MSRTIERIDSEQPLAENLKFRGPRAAGLTSRGQPSSVGLRKSSPSPGMVFYHPWICGAHGIPCRLLALLSLPPFLCKQGHMVEPTAQGCHEGYMKW